MQGQWIESFLCQVYTGIRQKNYSLLPPSLLSSGAFHPMPITETVASESGPCCFGRTGRGQLVEWGLGFLASGGFLVQAGELEQLSGGGKGKRIGARPPLCPSYS